MIIVITIIVIIIMIIIIIILFNTYFPMTWFFSKTSFTAKKPSGKWTVDPAMIWWKIRETQNGWFSGYSKFRMLK